MGPTRRTQGPKFSSSFPNALPFFFYHDSGKYCPVRYGAFLNQSSWFAYLFVFSSRDKEHSGLYIIRALSQDKNLDYTQPLAK